MSKMASHEPFAHLQPKLWAKEGLGVKLVVWLPTTKSRESTRIRRLQKECDMTLESSQRELQDFFRLRPNLRSEQGVMDAQSPKSLNRDSFGTPPRESREKVAFGCSLHGELQRILYGGRWWLPRVRVVVSQGSWVLPVTCSSNKGALECELTNFLVSLMQVRVSE